MYLGKAGAILNRSGAVTLAARGNLIPRAILVVYRLHSQMDAIAISVAVNCETIAGKDGKPRDVPSISITVSKTPQAKP